MTDQSQSDAPRPYARRDFLTFATTALGVTGAGLALWPFVDSMEPAADTLALAGPNDVDLSSLQPGQRIVVRWQSKPVFIVRRTADALRVLQEKGLVDRLRDPASRRNQQPPYATNWHRSLNPEFLVVVGICTHLGCIPDFRPTPGSAGLGSDWPGGFYCPCHGSRYDLAGRVFQNVPAPYNLPVPPYEFAAKQVVRIGQNPKGSTFDFRSIEQV
jgi:ubiquinol-cytochrome c reductase iron-sulfur subunit